MTKKLKTMQCMFELINAHTPRHTQTHPVTQACGHMRILQDPFYSKPQDVPPKPPCFAGKEWRIPSADALAAPFYPAHRHTAAATMGPPAAAKGAANEAADAAAAAAAQAEAAAAPPKAAAAPPQAAAAPASANAAAASPAAATVQGVQAAAGTLEPASGLVAAVDIDHMGQGAAAEAPRVALATEVPNMVAAAAAPKMASAVEAPEQVAAGETPVMAPATSADQGLQLLLAAQGQALGDGLAAAAAVAGNGGLCLLEVR